MFCNVTMQQPTSRVVGLESDNDKAISWEEYDVPPWRIIEFDVDSIRSKWGVTGLLD